MKNFKLQRRFYWSKAKDLIHNHVVAKETDLEILTNKKLDREFVEERMRQYRWDIESYIIKDNSFLTALKPISVELTASAIVQEMAEKAKQAYVGPMATVAGAVAEFLGKDLIKKGYKEVIVENGGNTFLKVQKARSVGIYAGKAKQWSELSLTIKPKDTPLGVSCASGTIGHSLSFGCADCVVIVAKHAALADAVATATVNRVQVKQDLENAMNFARAFKGVLGGAIILKKDMVSWGKIEFSPTGK